MSFPSRSPSPGDAEASAGSERVQRVYFARYLASFGSMTTWQ